MPEKSDDIKRLSISEALSPLLLLMFLLAYNIFFSQGVLLGDYSNQLILLISALFGLLIGLKNKVKLAHVFSEIYINLKSVKVPVLILFLVGALAGTWLISGVIPMMVYCGLQFLHPDIFLPASVLIAAMVSLATGSSWTTSATVGMALVGIGAALGISSGIVAGAVISGAYFGDKMSPLSDTTNLAPAMAGTDLFQHIKYMSLTTIPTFLISIFVFIVIGVNLNTVGETDLSDMLITIKDNFYLSYWLFSVPASVILLIVLKVSPVKALLLGVVLASLFAVYFQQNIILSISDSATQTLVRAIFTDVQIETSDEVLNGLFASSGMKGMIWTIVLIVSAMIFGGVLEAIGALRMVTEYLLRLTTSVFGLFSSTVVSCLGLNLIASDQYLAIVIPGKMFKQAYRDKNLAPENLSRTLEDSGTVTSVLIPWNTCGAYQSSVLGVSVSDYFFYAVFNYLSPFMTLIFAAFSIKIKQLHHK